MTKDIDFIKWMCGKAEGFSISQEYGYYYYIHTPSGSSYICEPKVFKASFRWADEVYPLLLRFAFEKVMIESEEDIYLTKNCIKVYSSGDKKRFYTEAGFTNAIEEFLKDRFEQETE